MSEARCEGAPRRARDARASRLECGKKLLSPKRAAPHRPAAEHRVRSILVVRRHDREGGRGTMEREQVPDVVGLDQRNVAGQGEQAEAACRQLARRRRNRPGLPSCAPSPVIRAP